MYHKSVADVITAAILTYEWRDEGHPAVSKNAVLPKVKNELRDAVNTVYTRGEFIESDVTISEGLFGDLYDDRSVFASLVLIDHLKINVILAVYNSNEEYYVDGTYTRYIHGRPIILVKTNGEKKYYDHLTIDDQRIFFSDDNAFVNFLTNAKGITLTPRNATYSNTIKQIIHNAISRPEITSPIKRYQPMVRYARKNFEYITPPIDNLSKMALHMPPDTSRYHGSIYSTILGINEMLLGRQMTAHRRSMSQSGKSEVVLANSSSLDNYSLLIISSWIKDHCGCDVKYENGKLVAILGNLSRRFTIEGYEIIFNGPTNEYVEPIAELSRNKDIFLGNSDLDDDPKVQSHIGRAFEAMRNMEKKVVDFVTIPPIMKKVSEILNKDFDIRHMNVDFHENNILETLTFNVELTRRSIRNLSIFDMATRG